MSRKRKLKDLIGTFKDKASLIKATLSTKHGLSSIQVAVIRATTHASASSPPEHRVAAILTLGEYSLPVTCACIGAIMNRLHSTKNAFVALKCLLILHNIMAKGSLLYKDNLSFCPSSGGHNSLNLSGFYGKSDIETRELSTWVRWYAAVLERNTMTSRILGFYLSPPSRFSINFDKIGDFDGKLRSFSTTDLVKEIDIFVCMVEEICEAPESERYRKNEVVHEITILVGQDYRSTQYHIMIRLSELGDRASRLNYLDSSELIMCLTRLGECRKRLNELFIRRKNDSFWEMVSQRKMEIEKVKDDMEKQSLRLWT